MCEGTGWIESCEGSERTSLERDKSSEAGVS